MTFQRLLHLGNLLVDVVLTVPALPERGADVLATQSDASAGGGFNVMAAAARQGLGVAYAGTHGTGPFGELARAACAQEGIDLIRPPKTGMDTGFVIALVDTGGERTFLTSPGAEATLTADDLAPVQADPGDVIYLSGYSFVHPASRSALLGWLERVPDGQHVVFDPGPLVPSIPSPVLDTVLSRADWVTCNMREATLLTGSPDPLAAVAALTQRTGGGGVLVRMGPDGCLLGRPGTEPVHVPGFRVNVLDTNGAGDTHTGTFLAALAGGAEEIDAVRRANAAAALSVTRRGPATAPTREELAASHLLDSRS